MMLLLESAQSNDVIKARRVVVTAFPLAVFALRGVFAFAARWPLRRLLVGAFAGPMVSVTAVKTTLTF